jgi:trans-2,3-dihydro-3-hydroxyanthranilate isomerase
MPQAHYVLADVFTATAFGGNQLAVFPDADGLTAQRMQALARELNLAESTFVTPGEAPGHFRVRIFTPLAEVPFAGHPTIGTAIVLAALGRVPPRTVEVVLEEGVGPVRVALAEGAATLFMDGAPTHWPLTAEPSLVAEAVGLAIGDLAGTPWQASYGLAFLFVPVRDAAAVTRAGLRADRWAALRPMLRVPDAYVHAITDRGSGRADIAARMFAPDLGVTEDPATGSAAAALVGSLTAITPLDGRVALRIRQGVEMGRPSLIHAAARRASNGGVLGVSVSGNVVIVGEGRFTRLPDA